MKKQRKFSKIFFAICINFIFSVIFAFPAYGQKGLTNTQVSNALISKPLSTRSAGAEVKGHLPEFDGLPNQELEEEVNKKIKNAYDTFLYGIYDTTRTVEFSYTSEYTKDYASIILYFDESSTLSDSKATSFVIDLYKEEIIDITHVLGVNAVALCNDHINKTIAKNPSKYNANFAGITSEADFYVKNDSVVLLFDKYEIAPGSMGRVTFTLPIHRIVEMTITKNEYYFKQPYNVRMVRLNQFNAEFDYTYAWQEDKGEVTVLQDKNRLAVLKIGVNRYDDYQNSRKVSRVLEVSPEIVDGYTYVPIAFVHDVLGVFYTVNSDQSIAFSKWQ